MRRYLTTCCPASPSAPPKPFRRALCRVRAGADDQDRTGDLVLTKDVLCQLSYIGLCASCRLRQTGRGKLMGVYAGVTIEALDQSSERGLERETGIEPATNSLEGCDS